MRIPALNVIFYVIALSLLCSSSNADETVVSPHSESSDCSVCHVASVDKLRGWFVYGSTKRALKDDLNQVCLKCHTVEPTHAGGFLGVGKGHAVGKKPALNRDNLPLSSDGTINCATTCHNIHVSPDDGQLYLRRLRMPSNSLCLSCHNV